MGSLGFVISMNIGDLISKKDAKIGALVGQTNRAKAESRKLAAAAQRLLAERAEAEQLIGELREVVHAFEGQLGDAKIFQADLGVNMHATVELEEAQLRRAAAEQQLETALSELDKCKREIGILTRALASDPDGGEQALVHGQAAFEHHEADRLRAEMDAVCEKNAQLQARVEQMGTELELADAVRAELSESTVHADKLRLQVVGLEGRFANAVNEVGGLKGELGSAQSEIGRLRKEHKQTVAGLEDRIAGLMGVNKKFESAVDTLEAVEVNLTRRVAELEEILEHRDSAIAEYQTELSVLRSNVVGLDAEVRSLATSLEAESESNENLAARLGKVEAELERVVHENQVLKKRNEHHEATSAQLTVSQAKIEQLSRELLVLKSVVAEKEALVQELEQTRELVKSTLSGEIQRLSSQLENACAKSEVLAGRYSALSRESDQVKSLLASDTMARVGRILPKGGVFEN